jgi:hypothetical protein
MVWTNKRLTCVTCDTWRKVIGKIDIETSANRNQALLMMVIEGSTRTPAELGNMNWYGFVWIEIISYEFVWIYVNLCEFIWIYMGLCELTWININQHELNQFVRIYMKLCESIWILIYLYEFIWIERLWAAMLSNNAQQCERCERQCVAVRLVVYVQCARRCDAPVRLVVCGSAPGSVRLSGSVWQCAQ